jgi:hypothetical protein
VTTRSWIADGSSGGDVTLSTPIGERTLIEELAVAVEGQLTMPGEGRSVKRINVRRKYLCRKTTDYSHERILKRYKQVMRKHELFKDLHRILLNG